MLCVDNKQEQNRMVIQITLNNRPIGRFLAPAIHPSTEDENVVFAQKRRFIEKRLNEKLSRYYILIHSIIVLLASISLIILQVVLIVNNAPCSTGSGIWFVIESTENQIQFTII